METQVNENKPFFLYLPYTATHFPTMAHPDFDGSGQELIIKVCELTNDGGQYGNMTVMLISVGLNEHVCPTEPPSLQPSLSPSVSTFPTQGKKTPKAHLHLPLKGRFDFFSHHGSFNYSSQPSYSLENLYHDHGLKRIKLFQDHKKAPKT